MDLNINNELLEYDDDTVLNIRKLYNLDKPKELEQIINIIEEWINKQPHFKKKSFAKKYLLNEVITAKGSVERAKVNLEKLCTLKTLYLSFFQQYDLSNQFFSWKDYCFLTLLPKLTDKNYRVFVTQLLKDGLKTDIILNVYRSSALYLEYMKMYDCNDGIIVISDLRKINLMELLTEVNVSDLRQIVVICLEGYGLRVKGINFITSSTAIEVFIKLFKPLLSPKIGSRIHVHKTPDTLHDLLPKEILPVDFGGNEASLEVLSDRWRTELTKKENLEIFKDLNEACTDELLRPKSAHDEPYMGMVGTFRTLSVD